MFSTPNRPDHRVRLQPVEALEDRALAAVTSLAAEAVVGPAPARRGGVQAVTISGSVRADQTLSGRANALLFDESSPGVPTVIPITLTPRGDGSASFSVPLTLPTKVRPADRDGRGYAVAISVQERAGLATAVTHFVLGAPQRGPNVRAARGR